MLYRPATLPACLFLFVLFSFFIGACGEDSKKPSYPTSGEAPGSDEDISVRFPSEDEEEPSEPSVACDDRDPEDDFPDFETSPGEDQRVIEGQICAGDRDWIPLELHVGDQVDVRVVFRSDEGDLDVALYRPDLVEVVSAQSSDDDERFLHVARESGRWWVSLYGFARAENSYRAEISVTRAEACENDGFEPDALVHQGALLGSGKTLERMLCPGEVDHQAISLREGEELVLEVSTGSHNLDVALFAPDGGEVFRTSVGGGETQIVHTAAQGGLFVLRAEGEPGAYTLSSSVSPAFSGGVLVRGEVQFEDPFLLRGPAEVGFVHQPVQGARVEVVGERSGAVFAHTQTDGRGAFEVRMGVVAEENVYARVLAQHSGPSGVVEVVTEARRIYAIRSPVGLDVSVLGEHEVRLLIGDGPSLSAPFNTLDAVLQGTSWWWEVFGVRGPLLHMIWAEGKQLGCGTCYHHEASPPSIYLYGLPTDNDALDDPVILHELGHYLQNQFSHEDSPGGDHDGTPVDPRLAYAEGWATAFATMVRDHEIYYDTLSSGLLAYDMEMPDADFRRFRGEGLSDDVSEYLVAAIFWDLYDGPNEESDEMSAGSRSVLPMMNFLGDRENAVFGYQGVDMADFLAGAYCGDIVESEALDLRLQSASFPMNAAVAQPCKKPGTPLTLRWGAEGVELFSSRDLPEGELYACGEEGCSLWVEFENHELEDSLSLPSPPARTHYLLARASKGSLHWMRAWPNPSLEPRVRVWKQAPRAASGGPVVEFVLPRE